MPDDAAEDLEFTPPSVHKIDVTAKILPGPPKEIMVSVRGDLDAVLMSFNPGLQPAVEQILSLEFDKFLAAQAKRETN